MAKRILFVDDEPKLLMGLQRSLRSMRNEWEMVFVASGAEALEVLARQSFDVVVTDMRMPGMDGAQLLEEVKKRSPQSLRMILSGQSDRETVLRSVNPTHQYLSKPCEGEELKARLLRAFALRDLLENPALKELASKLDSLPSLPTLYLALMEEIRSPEPSIAKVSRLISADMAMTARVLQLVNSAFFGLRCEISKASHAVELLGLDIVRALVLSIHIFSSFETDVLTAEDLQYLWGHSLGTSNYAKRLAAHEHLEPRLVDDAFTAGLLHDAGKLILAYARRPEYRAVLETAAKTGKGIYQAEREVLGCSHAEVAAYLFGLWGLPGPIIEAVAWHHQPSESPHLKFSSLAAVHVASFHQEEKHPARLQDKTPLDEAFLQRIECSQRLPLWRTALEAEDSKIGAGK
jgi:HD-like signal output (HDOD) protein/ActR/RegA family two-component response regulator